MVQPTVRARWAGARKIGIVAVARRLVIDLWRYLDAGVIPEGALCQSITRTRTMTVGTERR